MVECVYIINTQNTSLKLFEMAYRKKLNQRTGTTTPPPNAGAAPNAEAGTPPPKEAEFKETGANDKKL